MVEKCRIEVMAVDQDGPLEKEREKNVLTIISNV